VEEPVSIACIKTFAADYDLNTGNPYIPELKPATGKKVAVVGAGPAGLSAAYYLLADGHEVDIFEAMPKPGGMLRYGIPEYRLPKNVVDAEVAIIEKMGANFNYGVKVGEDISLEYLQNKYDAVFLGIGAWKSSPMRCEGENTPGVLGGIDFLIKVAENKPVKIGEKVIVVGGGNTAMDVARTSIRLGAKEVRVVYRRSEEQMPAEEIEIKEAKEEGVIFSFLSAPSLVLSNGEKVTGLKCEKMVLGEKDASGRQSPLPTGEFVEFEADTIIAAIGQEVDCGKINVGQGKKKNIVINEGTFETNLKGVFAGGDAATGPKIAIDAVAQGGRAAAVISSYLVVSDPDQSINDIMQEEVIYVETHDDQEIIANIFKKYGFMALPVVDKEHRLIGIITFDDIMDVMEDEATEDFQRMAAMVPSDEAYLDLSVIALAKQRIPWLMILMLGATVTGGIITKFENILSTVVVLTAFIPMLMDTGGNSGNQSSTLIIRGLALGNVNQKDIWKVLWKEFRISLLVGIILASVNFAKNMLFDKVGLNVSLTVSLTVATTVMLAKMVGGTLPLIAKKLKLDPAIMAGPLITTIVDALVLLVYFGVASALLIK
jgi:NADPH-dependent glutamate synthase beta subunit-like oxidoreductase/cation transporter-like permease